MQFTRQLSALRHPQFFRYWLGSFTSVGATQLQVMGLGWLIYELSNSSLTLGYLGAAAGIPATVITLFGGALADRLDKRLVLIVTSLLTAGLLGVLALLDYLELAEVWHVLLITAAISVVTGFDWPVRQSIFPAFIERDDMMSAVALTTFLWQATRMVMPAMGGIMIAVADTWLLFACCSAGFFFMFLVLLTLRVNASVPAPRHSTLQQIRQGFRYILQQRLFLVLILLSYALSFFASSYMQLMPAFADMLAVDETGFGYLLSIGGIGAVLGTVIAGTLQHSIHLGRVMILAALVFLVFLYVFAWVAWAGYTGSFAMALAAIFAAAVFYSIFMVTSTGVLQLEVPDELRGRVMGFHAITYNLMPLGALFSGAIASWSNPSAAIAVSTSIVALFVLWIWLKEAEVTTINGGQLAH